MSEADEPVDAEAPHCSSGPKHESMTTKESCVNVSYKVQQHLGSGKKRICGCCVRVMAMVSVRVSIRVRIGLRLVIELGRGLN